MKTIRTFRSLAALVAVAVLVLLAVPAVDAQDLRLPGLTGGSLSESELDRGTSVVIVWASWSPRGRDIVPRVNAIASRWGGQARVVTVNFQEDRATVQQFLADKDLRVPVYLDTEGTFSKKNAVTNLPGLLVIKNGEIAFRGKLPDDPDSILAEILG